jgi:hypothetical protein
MVAAETLLDRAAELKRQLLEFSQQRRYDRAFREMLAEQGEDAELWDENVLLDAFDRAHLAGADDPTLVEQEDRHPAL